MKLSSFFKTRYTSLKSLSYSLCLLALILLNSCGKDNDPKPKVWPNDYRLTKVYKYDDLIERYEYKDGKLSKHEFSDEFSNDPSVKMTREYVYNTEGKLSQINVGPTKLLYNYLSSGLLDKIEVYGESNSLLNTSKYKYEGDYIKMISDSGEGMLQTSLVYYYNTNGSVSKTQLINTSGDVLGDLLYEYDSELRTVNPHENDPSRVPEVHLPSKVVTNYLGTKATTTFEYDFDNVGKLIKKTSTRTSEQGVSFTDVFTYEYEEK